MENILTWGCTPRARQREDGLWYPSVIFTLNGQRQREIQYEFPLDDEATAMTFARTFARDELTMIKQSVALELKRLLL